MWIISFHPDNSPERDIGYSCSGCARHQGDINNADSMGIYIFLQMEINDLWKGAVFSNLREGTL